jgi:hypothetical protein
MTIEPVAPGKNVRERCLDIVDALLQRDGGTGAEGFAGASESDVCQGEDTIAAFVTASRVDAHGKNASPPARATKPPMVISNTASSILIVIASGAPSPAQNRTYHRSDALGWFVGNSSIVACPTIPGHVE